MSTSRKFSLSSMKAQKLSSKTIAKSPTICILMKLFKRRKKTTSKQRNSIVFMSKRSKPYQTCLMYPPTKILNPNQDKNLKDPEKVKSKSQTNPNRNHPWNKPSPKRTSNQTQIIPDKNCKLRDFCLQKTLIANLFNLTFQANQTRLTLKTKERKR